MHALVVQHRFSIILKGEKADSMVMESTESHGINGITRNHTESLESHGITGITRNHMESHGITWNHMESMESHGITRNHTESLGITWNHLESHGMGNRRNACLCFLSCWIQHISSLRSSQSTFDSCLRVVELISSFYNKVVDFAKLMYRWEVTVFNPLNCQAIENGPLPVTWERNGSFPLLNSGIFSSIIYTCLSLNVGFFSFPTV